MSVSSYHVMNMFQNESTHYTYLNAKELLAQNRHELRDCNETWTHNHLVHIQTLNHLAKLAKWLRWL